MICNEWVPACSPSLVEGLELPLSAEQVARLPLATTKGHTTGWLDWFAAADFDDISSLDFIEYKDGGLAFDSATADRGVAMVIGYALNHHELAIGTLVIVNPLATTLNFGIYLDYPETQHPDAKILAFADWLKSVITRLQAG